MKKIWILAAHKKDEILWDINRITFDYPHCVEKTNLALPFIIPTNTKNIDRYIEMFDAFIIPWGNDIHPELYGENITQSQNSIKEHDLFLIDFLHKVIPTRKPVLWICKWLQIMNVFFSGTLKQNIENHMHELNFSQEIHNIDIKKDSFLFEIFGQYQIPVNSIHHQCINTLGTDLKVCATSQDDGIIEAIAHNSLPLYGVQWHPESLSSHQELFNWFIKSIK